MTAAAKEACPSCGKPLVFCGNRTDGYYYGCFRMKCKVQKHSRHMRTKEAAIDDYHGRN